MVATSVKSLGSTENKRFEYGYARVRDFAVKTREIEENKNRPGRRKLSKTIVESVSVNDQPLQPSRRFWTSLQCRFGFNSNIFRYFRHDEVFDRISQRAPDDRIRFCIERDTESNKGRLLAVTNPTSSCVNYQRLRELLGNYDGKGVSYSDGIVRSVHSPKVGGNEFQIAGDSFCNQFVIDTPIVSLPVAPSLSFVVTTTL